MRRFAGEWRELSTHTYGISTMSSILVPPQATHLDILLDEVCRALQLTQTQFNDAEQKYTAVGEWLAAPESVLASYRPRIYPQGSVALLTTCRPWRHEEYDVDLVCELDWTGEPMTLYDLVGRRLAEHHYYKTILKGKKRCWCLNYAGAFHLDILPARPDLISGPTAIKVPDKELRAWSPSNPKGYVSWYHGRARTQTFIEARAAEPLPDNDPAEARPPLTRAVQLFKRHRDIRFNGDEQAPRSVVLTTLAANQHCGEATVYEALLHAVKRIRSIIATSPGIPIVPNPANPAENFAESWQSEPESYWKFVNYIDEFHTALVRLPDQTLGSGLDDTLQKLFGEEIAKRAVEAWGRRIGRARTGQNLRIGAATGLTIITEGTRQVPRNTFYGSAPK
jgi:hypothetical protein